MPYRATPLVLPAPKRRVSLRALRGFAFGASLPLLLSGSVQRIPPGDDERPGSPVEHALLLGGDGITICALTRVANARLQVVCTEAQTAPFGPAEWRVAAAWDSPMLRQILPVQGIDGSVERGAIGLREDGTLVQFFPGYAEAQSVATPGTGAHGSITRLLYIDCCSTARNHETLGTCMIFARTSDGSVLSLAIRYELPLLAMRTTWSSVALYSGSAPTPPASDDPLRLPNLPPGVVGAQKHPDLLLHQSPLLGVARGMDLIATINPDGRVQAFDSDGGVLRTVVLHNAPPRGISLVGTRANLCVQSDQRSWFCLNDPIISATQDSLPKRAFHPVPSLDGAEELVFGDDVSCARWRSGSVRCRGRIRVGSILHRAPTAIHGMDQVSSIVHAQGLPPVGPFDRPYGPMRDGVHYGFHSRGSNCVLRRGEVWCWGAFVDPHGPSSHFSDRLSLRRPRQVPLPENVTLLASPHVAARGASIWYWGLDINNPSELPADPGDRSAITSLAEFGTLVCARRASSRVSCWRESEGRWSSPRRVPALERGSAWEQHSLCAHTGLGSVGAGCDVVPDDEAWRSMYETEIPHLPSPACAVSPDGRVACSHHPTDANRELMPGLAEIVALPSGCTASEGCALRRDGQVLCWAENDTGLVTQGEGARAVQLVPLTRAP